METEATQVAVVVWTEASDGDDRSGDDNPCLGIIYTWPNSSPEGQ